MKILNLFSFIKLSEGLDAKELPISKGTRVLYDGAEYEAINHDTGRQGWEWRLLRGRNKNQSGDTSFFFQYDHPIYNLPKDNSRATGVAGNAPTLKPQGSDIPLPAGVSTPAEASMYAINLGKRLPELESFIARDGEGSARYAKHFNFEFIKAEPTIMKDAYAAFLYATGVTKKRWAPEVEALIRTNRQAWNKYALAFGIPN